MTDAATLPDPLEEVAPPKGRHGAAAWASGSPVGSDSPCSRCGWSRSSSSSRRPRLATRSVPSSAGTTTPARAGSRSSPSSSTSTTRCCQRYFDWLGGLLTGDLGTSVAGQPPVSELISDNVVNSLVLVLLAAVVMIPVAFGIAMISANYRRRRPDTVIQTILLALAGLPEFVIGILLVALFSTVVFTWLPAVTISSPEGHPWDEPKVDDPARADPGAARSRRTSPASCAPPCSRCSTATTSSWPGSRASRRGW